MNDLAAAWAAAFVKAQSQMPDIPKDKTATIPSRNGPGYTYSYADLPSIIERVRPILATNGLAFAQSVEHGDGIAVFTRIYHKAGHFEEFGPIVLPGGQDARSAGSAITYARRYALCAALGIAADEDDDARTGSAGVSNALPGRQSAGNSPVPGSAPAPQVRDQEGGAAHAGSPHQANGSGSDSPFLAPTDVCLKGPGNPNGLTKPQILKIAREVALQWGATQPSKYDDVRNLPPDVMEVVLVQCKGKVVPA